MENFKRKPLDIILVVWCITVWDHTDFAKWKTRCHHNLNDTRGSPSSIRVVQGGVRTIGAFKCLIANGCTIAPCYLGTSNGEVKWSITACRVEKINKYFSFSIHPWYLLSLGRHEAPFQRNINTILYKRKMRINRWGNLTKTESNNQMLWGAVIPLQTVIPSEIRQKLVLTQWLLLAITDTTYSGQYSSQQMTREKMILTGTLPENDIRYRVSQKKHSYKIFGLEIMLFTCSQT